jgi:hypothetical protein
MKMSDTDLEMKELEAMMEKMANLPRDGSPPIRSPGEQCMYERYPTSGHPIKTHPRAS